MRTVFLLTARLKSSRLPHKVLADLVGKPAIVHLLDRVKQMRLIDDVVICTSTNPEDDRLCEIARAEGVGCFRGSEEDVLARLHQSAIQAKADYVVNATADNPLVDPEYVDKMVEYYARHRTDLMTAYQLPRGAYGWGLDVAALGKVCAIKAETDTEVWGEYFTKTGLFTVHDLEVEPRLRRPDVRLTLDYPEDLALLRELFARLYSPGRIFSLREVVELLDAHPELPAINRHCEQLYQDHLRRSASMRLKDEIHRALEHPRPTTGALQ